MDDNPVRGHKNRRFCSRGCKERASKLRLKYNLSPSQFRALVAATGGICPICLRHVTQWQVEHNHKTREVYGVVCGGCNVGPIAYSCHDIEQTRRLLVYLENPPIAAVLGETILVPENGQNSSKIHKIWGHHQKPVQ
jgi:hypothetical protein